MRLHAPGKVQQKIDVAIQLSMLSLSHQTS